MFSFSPPENYFFARAGVAFFALGPGNGDTAAGAANARWVAERLHADPCTLAAIDAREVVMLQVPRETAVHCRRPREVVVPCQRPREAGVSVVLLIKHYCNCSWSFISLHLVVCCRIIQFITIATSYKDHSWQLLIVFMYKCVGTTTQYTFAQD